MMGTATEIKQRIQGWATDVSRAYPFLAADPAAGEREPPSSHLTTSRLRASLRGLLLAMIRDGLGSRSPDEASDFVASVAAVDMTERRAQVDVPKIVDWLVGHGCEVVSPADQEWEDDGQDGSVSRRRLGSKLYTLRTDRSYSDHEGAPAWCGRLYSGEDGRTPVLTKEWKWCPSVLLAQRVAEDILVRVAMSDREAVCAHCGKPAACFGSYEGRPTAYACDTCCGHGCEDGHCEPVAVDASAPAAEPACVDDDHHPLDPRPANGYEPSSGEPIAPMINDPAWTPEERASCLGCLYGAATIGRCGEPVGKGKRYCGKHGRHELPVSTDGAELARTVWRASIVTPTPVDVEALPVLEPQHTPPTDRFDGEVWRGRVKVDDDWAHVAVGTVNGATAPMSFTPRSCAW